MDIIRRNTDYALRLITLLTGYFKKGTSVSARNLSKIAVVPYPLTCKLLQKLQKQNIVISTMGPKGGYGLARNPEHISFLEIVETIQGPIHVNRCFLGQYKCPLKGRCPLHGKLKRLQDEIVDSLRNTKIAELTSVKKDKQEHME